MKRGIGISAGNLSEITKMLNILRGIIDPITTKCKDLGTSDYLTGPIEQHEKMAWMLRAHFR